MPASFSHPQTFRSTPLRQCCRPFPTSLPHLVPGRGNLYPCVRGVPLFSKDSVPISCYLIRMSHFRTSPTRSSLTNAEVDGPLRDSEEIHCAALPLCLFVRPIFSGVPSSPLAEAHHPWLDGRVSIAAGVSIPGVCIYSFPSDVVIRSATEPEVNPKPYSTSQGASQDIRALKMTYITNQEGLNDEANFYGFYTQEGVQANWNWAKIFTETEDMNFTSQRFLSPSICEYPTLEGDSSSNKERPEANPIIGVKRSLSAFQKAQDQEKWPRKLGVMINSTEPAKPTSSMESLQPIQLGSTQSYLWEPGDHLNQSGGIPEVLCCTRTQEIREPDDVQTKPRHPGDIIHEPEEFYNFIPCTSPHRNKKIPIITKLPYLESQALKLQQLFFLQSMHDISTFQTIKKIPRKLTYPLKPSRYKEDTIYIHLAKILIIKPPTATTPKHLDLSRLLSIESCGVLNPPILPFQFDHNLHYILSPIRLYLWSIHQASINHFAIPDFQPATPSLNQSSWVGPRVNTNWAWTANLPYCYSPQTSYTIPRNTVLLLKVPTVLILLKTVVLVLTCLIRISGGFTGALLLRIMAYYLVKKSLSVDSPRQFPFQSSSSFEERTFPPYLLPMEEDDFSASLPSFGFAAELRLQLYHQFVILRSGLYGARRCNRDYHVLSRR
ncbi:hypothetical protein YC2023_049964 [Brassica napus]